MKVMFVTRDNLKIVEDVPWLNINVRTPAVIQRPMSADQVPMFSQGYELQTLLVRRYQYDGRFVDSLGHEFPVYKEVEE